MTSPIERARELERQATPGPWRAVAGGNIHAPDGPNGTSCVHVATVGDFLDEELLPFNKDRWQADQRTIVIARNVLPAALELAEESMYHGACKICAGDDMHYPDCKLAAFLAALAANLPPEEKP